MKKLLLLLALVLAASLSALAQDIIILKSSEKIKAKIVEISSSEIAYKKVNYLDGPTFRLDLSEVSSVIYANGDVQAFNVTSEGHGAVNTDNGNSTGKLKFNPNPQGRMRPFGITVGYVSKQININGQKFPMLSSKNGKFSPALILGFHIAPEIKYGVGIQTGVYYEMTRYTYNGGARNGGFTQAEHTLSIPLRLQYRYEIIRDLSVFLYTGPVLDIHLAYVIKAGEERINLYGEGSDINHFQVLFGLGAGIRYKGIQLMMGGDWGLTYANDDYLGAPKFDKPFFISLSYLF